MKESNSINVSRILLTSINTLICVVALCITIYLFYIGALGAGYGGRNVSWLELLYNTKASAFIGALAFSAIVGQTEIRKLGFISGLAVSLSLSIFGIIALSSELKKNLSMNSMDSNTLIICLIVGVGLFMWTRYEFKQKHNITIKDWIFVGVLSCTGTTFLLMDWYFF